MEMNDIDTEKNNSKKTLLNYVQELGVVLKTSFPLLALSAEKMIDQLAFKLRGNAQEELFRHLCKLEKQTFQAWILKIELIDLDIEYKTDWKIIGLFNSKRHR